MRKLIAVLVILLSIHLSCISANIVYPWRATTAIVKSGDSFEIWFNADANQLVSAIQFKSEFLTIAGTEMAITNGSWTFDPISGNKYNQKISIKIPVNTPEDRYDLILNTNLGNVISHGGVKVVKEFKSEYYLVHYSDPHLYQNGYDSDLILRRISLIHQMSNIMDAPIIICTGDNMYSLNNNPFKEQEFFIGKSASQTIGMSKASAATFVVQGNHDAPRNVFDLTTNQENADYINKYYGLQNHSFKYGTSRYINLNNAWGLGANNNKEFQYQVDEAIAWLIGAGAGGNFIVGSGHMYDRMYHYINNVKPMNLCLSGHRHSMGNENPWEITPGGPRISYTCNDLRGGMKYMIYRINNNTGTFTLPAGPTGLIEAIAGGDKTKPETWVPRLKQTFSAANNGTIGANSALIENKFPFPILGGKVRFIVPKGNTYAATNGTVIQQFDGDNVCVVDVSFDVQSNSSTTVYIAAGEPIDLCPDDPNKLVPGLCGCGVPEGSCDIPVSSISIGPATTKLHLHVSKQLTASILPTTATNKNIDWQSSNPEVATVSPEGFVVAVGGGTATITATTQSQSKSASTHVIVNPSITVYPAEDAELFGVLVVNNQPGYNGDGFADFTNLSSDYIKWTVYAPEDGDYILSFRYALMSNSRPLRLSVNDEVKIASIDFPITGSWSNWQNYNTTQALVTGNNTITLTAIGSSGGNFDELVIANATTATKNLHIHERTFQLFPNPYKKGKLSIALNGFDNQSDMTLRISNMLGQIIFEQKIDSNTTSINIPVALKESTYMVCIESDISKIFTKLIVR